MRRRRVAGLRAASTNTIELGPITLPNAVVAASGTFGHGDEVAQLCDPRGIGAVTTKSVAAYAWDGNPARRVAETAGGGMLNSVGLPGPGIEAWIAHDLPALEARGARVIASIWGRSVDEYAAAAGPLKAVADRVVALEVNLSCPNVEARRHVFAHSADATRTAVTAGRRHARRRAARVRQALTERHRHRRDRARGRRRRRDRAHVGEHGDGASRSIPRRVAVCSVRVAAV